MEQSNTLRKFNQHLQRVFTEIIGQKEVHEGGSSPFLHSGAAHTNALLNDYAIVQHKMIS